MLRLNTFLGQPVYIHIMYFEISFQDEMFCTLDGGSDLMQFLGGKYHFLVMKLSFDIHETKLSLVDF